MSKSNIWINAQTTFHPPKVSDSAQAILRDLVASQHQENEGKRPKTEAPIDEPNVHSSTSLMWPSRGAHDAEGRAICGAWEPPWLRRLRVLATRVFIFL
ncbi:hypothetical protein ES332_A08G087600v1 [Gossypium tomentosum]|uniref:Uncharacterized protein n=1 Tax=Gossypium tomentosum TaxID=34277 RepID=A0A5D2PF21_GOSTO|nr:hypothetical protein ES332_A08G087600v1 [Gossypium tomentosum]